MNTSLYLRAVRLLDVLACWAAELEQRAIRTGRAGDALATRRVAAWATLIWYIAEAVAEREGRASA